jgi:hypothetical protein
VEGRAQGGRGAAGTGADQSGGREQVRKDAVLVQTKENHRVLGSSSGAQGSGGRERSEMI